MPSVVNNEFDYVITGGASGDRYGIDIVNGDLTFEKIIDSSNTQTPQDLYLTDTVTGVVYKFAIDENEEFVYEEQPSSTTGQSYLELTDTITNVVYRLTIENGDVVLTQQ